MQVFRFPIPFLFWFLLPGILVGYYSRSNPMWCGLVLIFFIAAIAVLHRLPSRKIKPIACFASFALGFFVVSIHRHKNDQHFLHSVDGEKQHVQLTIRERFKKTKTERYKADVETIDGKMVNGSVLLHVDQKLSVGAKLHGYFAIYPHPTNLPPGAFDYGKYLSDKGIDGQAYVNSDVLKITGIEKDIFYFSDRVRNKITESLRHSGCDERELNVIAALLLGQQQDIAKDIINDYRAAGAVHILSVSGLHVGFVVLIISFLLKPLPNTPKWRIIKTISNIVALWIFAILAGLSPSVVRSAAMFSLMCIGLSLRRPVNIYHTLLASAFIILCFDPLLIFDIGFQLSYAALFFIVWLQPLMNRIWEPKNGAIRYLRDIVTVSFAAQLGTMPLTLYYFHQFPGLFFITNLLIIPMLTIIMVIGLTAAVLALFDAAPEMLVFILEVLIRWMNIIIAKIASVESMVFQDVPMSFATMVTLFGLIVFIAESVRKPRFVTIVLSLLMLIGFQVSILQPKFLGYSEQLIISNVRYKTEILHIQPDRLIAYSDIPQQRFRSLVTERFLDTILIKPVQNQMYFNGRKIFVTDSASAEPVGTPDVIILSRSPKINLERIVQNHKPSLIIADASNYPTFVELWKKTCQKEKIPFHHTAEKGSFILE